MTATTLPSLRIGHQWRSPLLTLFALVTVLLTLFWGTAVSMVDVWLRAQTYNHAFVVPPIALWLIWRQRAVLAPMQPRPAHWMLLPMAALALLWWLGELVNVDAAIHFALVALLICLFPLVLGWQVARAVAFPLLFMLFAVPIGDFLTPTLMYWTAEVLVYSLRLVGMPVFQEGQYLVIPSGRWAVVEACGGVRYLMATFMVGSLFAYLNFQSARKRWTFILISLLVPVVANWVRAFLIVMVAHATNNKIGAGDDHILYGWFFFGFVIIGLFFIGARWADPEPVAPDPGATGSQPDGSQGSGAFLGQWVLVGLLAVAAVGWPLGLQHHRASLLPPAPVSLSLPAQLGTWQGAELAPGDWTPAFTGARLERATHYRSSAGQVTVHLAYYRGQGEGSKLVSSVNRLVEPGSRDWHVLSQGRISTPAAGQPVEWRTNVLVAHDGSPARNDPNRARLTVWRLYWLGGRLEHQDIRAKLWQAVQSVRGDPDDGAAILLVSHLEDDDAARQQLASFVSENFTMLEQTLARARESR